MEGCGGRVPGRASLDLTASHSDIAHPLSTHCKHGSLLWLSSSPDSYDYIIHSPEILESTQIRDTRHPRINIFSSIQAVNRR